MRKLLLIGLGFSTAATAIGGAPTIGLAAPPAADGVTTLHFAVMRDGSRIGTSTIRLRSEGMQTAAEVDTHVRVTFAYVTFYRFDQHESEQWVDGKLVTMNSVTDDNGTTHRVSARSHGGALTVVADGKASEVDPRAVPASLWNASLVRKSMAINPQDGKVTPISVIDHGEERLVLQGRETTAHHYSIETSFPQEVWYDAQHRLVKVELRGSDGSTIWYQPG